MIDKVKLKESLYIINSICYEMKQINDELGKVFIPVESVILRELRKWEDIQICKLLDEFREFKKIDSDTYETIEPAILYINTYSGIRVARNKQLAHSNRDAKKIWEPWWIALMDKEFPNSSIERTAIYEIIQKVWKLLEFKYHKEIAEAHSEYFPEYEKFAKALKDRKHPNHFLVNVIPTINEIQRRLEERNIPFRMLGDD
jgi:hypothetical protein